LSKYSLKKSDRSIVNGWTSITFQRLSWLVLGALSRAIFISEVYFVMYIGGCVKIRLWALHRYNYTSSRGRKGYWFIDKSSLIQWVITFLYLAIYQNVIDEYTLVVFLRIIQWSTNFCKFRSRTQWDWNKVHYKFQFY
jgi:hypothetical protein